MPYTFIPTVESANFLKDLEKELVFAKYACKDYYGEVNKQGDQITFLVPGEPTISDATRSEIQTGMGTAETIEGASITLQINQLKKFNYTLGEIDEKQMGEEKANKLRSAYRSKAVTKIADEQDKYVAKVLAEDPSCQINLTGFTSGTTKFVSGTAGEGEINILKYINQVVKLFNKNNVTDKIKLHCICSPDFWLVLKEAYTALDTNNSAMLEGRGLGFYNGITFEKSNSCYNADGNSHEFVYFFTEQAFGFANPLVKIKQVEPDNAFATNVLGFTLYDGKVIKPKEIIVSQCAYL